ncbi:MAG: hypothetical protein R3362_07715, partial [Rhodothermales bacterium]|nr:hypothetical protein [Rhodothermales bacterium]
AWAQLAAAHLRAGNATEAARTAEEGLLLFPGQTALLHVAGRALTAANRPADAAPLLQEALELVREEEPENRTEQAALLELLGDAEAARGDEQAARRNWEAALELDPENEGLREKLERTP